MAIVTYSKKLIVCTAILPKTLYVPSSTSPYLQLPSQLPFLPASAVPIIKKVYNPIATFIYSPPNIFSGASSTAFRSNSHPSDQNFCWPSGLPVQKPTWSGYGKLILVQSMALPVASTSTLCSNLSPLFLFAAYHRRPHRPQRDDNYHQAFSILPFSHTLDSAPLPSPPICFNRAIRRLLLPCAIPPFHSSWSLFGAIMPIDPHHLPLCLLLHTPLPCGSINHFLATTRPSLPPRLWPQAPTPSYRRLSLFK